MNSSLLVARIADGELAAERLLVQRYGVLVRGFLRRKISCSAVVDDLFQECFLILIPYLRAGRLRSTDKLERFIVGIARRLVFGYLRSKKQAPTLRCDLDDLVSDCTSPEEAVERERCQALVNTLFSELKIARDREALTHRYYLGEDTETIARKLQISRAEVRIVLCRARQRLRSAIGRQGRSQCEGLQ